MDRELRGRLEIAANAQRIPRAETLTDYRLLELILRSGARLDAETIALVNRVHHYDVYSLALQNAEAFLKGTSGSTGHRSSTNPTPTSQTPDLKGQVVEEPTEKHASEEKKKLKKGAGSAATSTAKTGTAGASVNSKQAAAPESEMPREHLESQTELKRQLKTTIITTPESVWLLKTEKLQKMVSELDKSVQTIIKNAFSLPSRRKDDGGVEAYAHFLQVYNRVREHYNDYCKRSDGQVTRVQDVIQMHQSITVALHPREITASL